MNMTPTLAAALKRIRISGGQDPVRDWLILIAVFMVALVGLIVWNVWTFRTAANGGVIGGAPGAASPQVLEPSSLRSIHTLFDMRANEAAKYETGVYRYTDPSL